MKVKELIEILKESDPEAEVVMPVYNHKTETYGVVDHTHQVSYEQLSNDFFGTPGPMDSRLFTNEITDRNILLLCSLFPIKFKI